MIIREAEGALPQLVRVAEMPVSELHAPSGVVDERTGNEMTNMQFFSDLERDKGNEVFISGNGLTSPEGQAHNRNLYRDRTVPDHEKRGRFVVAVISKRPPQHQ